MPEDFSKSRSANFAVYPLLWLSVCLALGIAAAKYLVFDGRVSLAICLFSAICAAFFINKKFAAMFLALAFFAAGAMLFQIEDQNLSKHRLKKLIDENRIRSGDPIELEGILRGKPELAVGGFFLKLETEKAIYKGDEIKISGTVKLFAPVQNAPVAAEYESLNLQYGSRVRVACDLKREANFQNPGVISQKEILDQTETDATALIKSPLLVEKLGEERTLPPMAWIYERRQNLIIEFKNHFSVSTAGVLIASLLGDKYFLDRETAEIFREGGTFHVLVISGLHITFIGGLTLLFVRFFTRKKFLQFAIASALLWAYSLAVGLDVPVVRAAIMFTILLFSQVIHRRGTLLNALGACVLILLVWRPNDLFTPSFQLTIVSVAAIVATAFPLIEKLRAIGKWSPTAETPFPPNVSQKLKRFCEMLYWREAVWKRDASRQIWSARIFKSPYLSWLERRNLQNPLRYIFEAFLVSLVVQLWLLPLLIVYFHRVSIFGVFLNLWVGVWIALESFAAIIAIFFAQINTSLALPFIKLTELFNWLMLSIPNLLTENYWASIRLPHYAGAAKAIYFLYFLPILFFAFALHRWNPFAIKRKSALFLRVAAPVFLLLLGLIIFHPLSAPRADGKLHIDFLDVGQGDSALITFPNGETLLVDGGGQRKSDGIYIRNEFSDEPEAFEPDTYDVGETVVSAFLWEKGYDRVDYILATHADADHMQGLVNVAKNFKIKAAFFGRTPFTDENFAELYSVLQRRKIDAVKLSKGDVLTFGDVKIETLFPTGNDEISDNNHSLVLRVVYGERKFLLTGDIEKEAERELLPEKEFLRSDVIKVAHHGSRTSSVKEFIDATSAKVAIIPVGKNSPFGHPHEEVLERWKNSGASVFTTGECGTITISSNGKDLWLETFLRQCQNSLR